MLARAVFGLGKQPICVTSLQKIPTASNVCLMRSSTSSSPQKDAGPDLDYNWWYKIASKNPRAEHWRQKFADLRWQYLQDPQVAKGDLVPIIVKDSPERDTKNWPTPVQPENPGKTRMLIFPEEFFNFMYSKTGVTGPYLIIWGSLGYIWSQEWLRYDEETALFLELTVLPCFLYHRIIIPRMWTFLQKRKQHKADALDSFRTASMAQLEIQNASEKLNFEMVKSARDYMFKAKKEMCQLQWEATYRQRLYEAFEKVKQRLDCQADLTACKARHENRNMVQWIVDNVVSSITPQQEKAALDKCILNLKSMSGSIKI